VNAKSFSPSNYWLGVCIRVNLQEHLVQKCSSCLSSSRGPRCNCQFFRALKKVFIFVSIDFTCIYLVGW
jgi:hypothetical protein